MSATDRTFAEVRHRFEEWREDAETEAELEAATLGLLDLLHEYKAGGLTEREARERLAALSLRITTASFVEGARVGRRAVGRPPAA